MKPAIAAAAQSFPGRGSIVWFLWVDRVIGLANKLSGFAVLLLVWQIALLLALLDGMIDLGAYAGIHCFSCAGLAAYLAWCLKASASGDRYSAALQIVAWSAVAGPFGAFVAAALSLPAAPISPKVLRDVDIDSLTPDPANEHTELLHVSLLDRRVRIEGACLVRPLMDVIAEGSQPEKLEALGIIYRKYEARLNVVLKRALQDSRYLGSSAGGHRHCQAACDIQSKNRRMPGRSRGGTRARPALARSCRGPAPICRKRPARNLACARTDRIRGWRSFACSRTGSGRSSVGRLFRPSAPAAGRVEEVNLLSSPAVHESQSNGADVAAPADVCLIVEGGYPYVVGGVASWADALMRASPQLTFHIIAIAISRATAEKNLCAS